MASAQLQESGPIGKPLTPFGSFDWAVEADSPDVSLLATTDMPPGGAQHEGLSLSVDFQNLKPIDITFTAASVSADGVFYLDPTIKNDTGYVWSGFSLQLVAKDPGQFLEPTTGHPDYVHFHDAMAAPDFVNPLVGSLSIDGSEVYGYYTGTDPKTGESLDPVNVNEESKVILSAASVFGIPKGSTNIWQYFGVHAPVADGAQFTLELTPITDPFGFAAGNETLLNTSVMGDQAPAANADGASPSQLAALSNGQAVAVWDDDNSGQVEARIVSAAGPAGSQITVGSGNDGTVAALANGNFIVVWRDSSANQGLGEIKYQIYSASGAPVGAPGRIFNDFTSSGTNYGEYNLSVAGLADGGYALTFTGQATGAAPLSQVYTYTYDQNGTNVGNIKNEVLSSSAVYNGLPQTAQLSNGNLVTTWQDGQGRVYAQIFTESGTLIEQLSLGAPYDNSTGGQGTPPDTVSHPTVAALANGNFVVAWDDETEHQIQFDIWNQRVAQGASPVVIPEAIALNQVASSDYDTPATPAIAALANGQFAITWADTSGSSIKAALFNPDGSFLNEGNAVSAVVENEIVVNKDQSSNQVAPNIVGLSGGGMYVDWGDESGQLGDPSGLAVAGQAFGETYSVTTRTTGNYSAAEFLANQISIDQGGNFIISDTAANIAANLDALNADPNVDQIILTDSGTPTLTLTPEQATSDWQAIGKIEGPYSLAVPTADILWQNASTGQASFWDMSGSTLVGGGPVSPNPGPSWRAVGTGQFNVADTHSDILWQNTATGQVSVWEISGSSLIGGGAVSPNPGLAWHAVGTGDFNKDGLSDILWQNTSTGQASIWEMNGNTLIGGGPVTPNPGTDWKAVGTGDFNMDGFSDILWQNTNTGQISIWEMNGNNLIGGGPVTPNPGTAWQAIGTGDFNQDGFSDILLQNKNTGAVSVWEMNGNNLIGGGPVSANPGTSWRAIGTGAGGSDILLQNVSGQTSIWEMNGNTIAGGGPVTPNPGPSWHAIGLS